MRGFVFGSTLREDFLHATLRILSRDSEKRRLADVTVYNYPENLCGGSFHAAVHHSAAPVSVARADVLTDYVYVE